MSILIGILLIIVGLGMIGFWTIHIISGKLQQGIKTLENGGYIIFHITIEIITGILCTVGGITIILTYSWGYLLALFASGMLFYTGINSMAWSEVKNKPGNAIMFIVPTILAITAFIFLMYELIQ